FTVDYKTADGTATAGSDYVAIDTQTLSFNTNDTSQTVSVTINGDTTYEPDETFFVNLSNATNGAVITDSQGVGTITNDDPAPPMPDLVIESTSAPPSVLQGGTLDFSYVVQNNGTAGAGAHVTGYMLDQVPDTVNNIAT